jgi:hypothetical protein
MQEKNGEFVPGKSRSDFDPSKIATHIDKKGFAVADEANKGMLKKAQCVCRNKVTK